MSSDPQHDQLLVQVTRVATQFEQLSSDVGEIKSDVKDVAAQVKLTNGRVTALEMWKERIAGAKSAYGWLPGVVVGIVAAAAGAGFAVIFGG